MPFYIASGKNAHTECSVKVFAETDESAFVQAKEQMPVVTGLERIESDGSLVPVTGIPFDSLQKEVLTPDQGRVQHGERIARESKAFSKAMIVLLLLVLVFMLGFCQFAGWHAAAPMPQK